MKAEEIAEQIIVDSLGNDYRFIYMGHREEVLNKQFVYKSDIDRLRRKIITGLQLYADEQSRERAIEFAYWLRFGDSEDWTKHYLYLEKRFKEWIKSKQDMIICSECGKPFKKKEIIIQGDVDTCDDCLCPE